MLTYCQLSLTQCLQVSGAGDHHPGVAYKMPEKYCLGALFPTCLTPTLPSRCWLACSVLGFYQKLPHWTAMWKGLQCARYTELPCGKGLHGHCHTELSHGKGLHGHCHMDLPRGKGLHGHCHVEWASVGTATRNCHVERASMYTATWNCHRLILVVCVCIRVVCVYEGAFVWRCVYLKSQSLSFLQICSMLCMSALLSLFT